MSSADICLAKYHVNNPYCVAIDWQNSKFCYTTAAVKGAAIGTVLSRLYGNYGWLHIVLYV